MLWVYINFWNVENEFSKQIEITGFQINLDFLDECTKHWMIVCVEIWSYFFGGECWLKNVNLEWQMMMMMVFHMVCSVEHQNYQEKICLLLLLLVCIKNMQAVYLFIIFSSFFFLAKLMLTFYWNRNMNTLYTTLILTLSTL